MGHFADCLHDSDYTQQPRISLEGSAFTAATHLSLLLLRIHQFPLPQEQGISKVHQAGIYFSSVCHWQKPRCPCLSGSCPSPCQADSSTASSLILQFSLSFTGCYWHAQLHACCICTHNANSRFTLLMLACLYETQGHTQPCVYQATCVCILSKTA